MKYYGLSRNGWIFFSGRVILFNIYIGHPNMLQFFGGLIGSYILTRIVFAVYYVFQKPQNKEEWETPKI